MSCKYAYKCSFYKGSRRSRTKSLRDIVEHYCMHSTNCRECAIYKRMESSKSKSPKKATLYAEVWKSRLL